jgi:hypothetical protein
MMGTWPAALSQSPQPPAHPAAKNQAALRRAATAPATTRRTLQSAQISPSPKSFAIPGRRAEANGKIAVSAAENRAAAKAPNLRATKTAPPMSRNS